MMQIVLITSLGQWPAFVALIVAAYEPLATATSAMNFSEDGLIARIA